MFCPQCGTLSYPTPSGDISCGNYRCGYRGPAKLRTQIGGKEVDLSTAKSQSKIEDRDYSVNIDSRDRRRYDGACPYCGENQLYVASEVRDIKWDEDVNQTHVSCDACGRTHTPP